MALLNSKLVDFDKIGADAEAVLKRHFIFQRVCSLSFLSNAETGFSFANKVYMSKNKDTPGAVSLNTQTQLSY
jgi:hypothetical protein